MELYRRYNRMIVSAIGGAVKTRTETVLRTHLSLIAPDMNSLRGVPKMFER